MDIKIMRKRNEDQKEKISLNIKYLKEKKEISKQKRNISKM